MILGESLDACPVERRPLLEAYNYIQISHLPRGREVWLTVPRSRSSRPKMERLAPRHPKSCFVFLHFGGKSRQKGEIPDLANS